MGKLDKLEKHGLILVLASMLVPVGVAVPPSYLLWSGTIVTGRVQNIETTEIEHPDTKEMDTEVRRVTYTYSDEDGNQYASEEAVGGFIDVREGGEVEVIYPAGNPSSGRIYHWLELYWGVLFGLMAPLFVTVLYAVAKAKHRSPPPQKKSM